MLTFYVILYYVFFAKFKCLHNNKIHFKKRGRPKIKGTDSSLSVYKYLNCLE